jgi:hypothetical protein
MYHNLSYVVTCQRNYDSVLGAISKHPMWSLSTNELFKDGSTEVCFRDLVVGSGLGTFRINNPQLMRQFRHHIMLHDGVDSRKRVQLPSTLCVTQKVGRRGIFNVEELHNALKAHYPHMRIMANLHLKSLKEQMMALQQCAVMVTPSGTVGMTNIFLPVGSCLIVVDYFDTRYGRSYPMDGMFFKQMPWLREIHYPFTKAEVDLSEAPAIDEWRRYRDHGKVIVNTTRLLGLVEEAFDWLNIVNNFAD